MKVRGHHLVCSYCFYGSGKATAREFFGIDNAIPDLLRMLQADPEMDILLAADFDDVCDICPIKTPQGCGRGKDKPGGIAAQSEKLRQWDRVILGRLGLAEGDTISARDLEQRIIERIPDIGEICTNCTSAAPSGWAEYRSAIRKGLWPKDKSKS